MLISTKGRYALRMMIDIAVNGAASPVPLKDIAQREEMPLKYLEQLARLLTRAGLLSSVRGQHGGYVLSRTPADIPVGDILRAAEGSTAPVSCLGMDGASCPRMDVCTTLDFWKGLDEVIETYVDSKTLADLAQPFVVGCQA